MMHMLKDDRDNPVLPMFQCFSAFSIFIVKKSTLENDVVIFGVNITQTEPVIGRLAVYYTCRIHGIVLLFHICTYEAYVMYVCI